MSFGRSALSHCILVFGYQVKEVTYLVFVKSSGLHILGYHQMDDGVHDKRSLPDDLVVSMILPRLPAQSVGRFKCACKLWFDAISDPSFPKSHLKCQTPGHIRFGDPTFEFKVLNEGSPLLLKASCNGLLVGADSIDNIVNPMDRRHYIINPIIRRYIKLPSPSRWCHSFLLHCDHALNRYKLLGWNFRNMYVMVLKDDQNMLRRWRKFRVPKGLSIICYTPASFDGGFYFLARRIEASGVEKWTVIAFDSDIGRFREIEIPNSEYQCSSFFLVATDESLYLVQPCWHQRRRRRRNFYVVYRFQDNLITQPINTRTKRGCWEFRFDCTRFEAEKIIDRYKPPLLDEGIVHINSIVWDIGGDAFSW